MEYIIDVWSQKFSAILMDGYMWDCPIDRPIDIAFTNKRLFAIPGSGYSAVESIERHSKRTQYAMLLGGVPATLFASKAAQAWERFRERRHAKKLEISDLMELESMKLAVVGAFDELAIEVEEQKRVWFTKVNSQIACFGRLSFGGAKLKGGLFLYRDGSARSIIKYMNQDIGVGAVESKKVALPDDQDQYWCDRILGP